MSRVAILFMLFGWGGTWLCFGQDSTEIGAEVVQDSSLLVAAESINSSPISDEALVVDWERQWEEETQPTA